MRKTTIGLITILIIQLLYGCKISKEIYYSYKSNWYSIDTVKRFVTSSSLISYGDYLLEFIRETNIKNELIGESGIITSSVCYDTTGVYLLGDEKRVYYEFDTFAIENKIVKVGKLSEKSLGQLYPDSDSMAGEEIIYSNPVDTVINNITCFYSTVASRNKNREDSIGVKVILLKKPKFNSLYKIGGGEFPDKDYCIVGFYTYFFKGSGGAVQEVDALRPLTEKEKRICESMISRSKSVNIDTIKGLTSKNKAP